MNDTPFTPQSLTSDDLPQDSGMHTYYIRDPKGKHLATVYAFDYTEAEERFYTLNPAYVGYIYADLQSLNQYGGTI